MHIELDGPGSACCLTATVAAVRQREPTHPATGQRRGGGAARAQHGRSGEDTHYGNLAAKMLLDVRLDNGVGRIFQNDREEACGRQSISPGSCCVKLTAG